MHKHVHTCAQTQQQATDVSAGDDLEGTYCILFLQCSLDLVYENKYLIVEHVSNL